MPDTMALTLRQRMSVALRALTTSSFPTDPNTFAGKLLGGIIPAGQQATERGTQEILDGYSTMPWLRAVASRISYDVAATGWTLSVAKNQKGEKVRNRVVQRASPQQRHVMLSKMADADELEAITDHPLLDLLANANVYQTGQTMMRVTQLHIDLAGESFWLIEDDPVLKMPVAIWPIPPTWVHSLPSPAVPAYRMRFRGWSELVPASKVIWFSDPNPSNPYGRGTGIARALGDELEIDDYAAKHMKSFYLNRARPDIIVWPKGDQGMQEGEVERLEENWLTRAGGFFRAFKPFFLKREVEIKELSQNFQSQQLNDIRKYERDTIMQVYGTSPEILGILSSGSNRATITQAEVIYQRRTQVPRLETLRTVMQERLVPMFDERLILNYVSPVVRDHELELDAAKANPAAPTIDEWRVMAGLPVLDDDKGKVHFGPMTWGVAEFGMQPPPKPDTGVEIEDDDPLLDDVDDGDEDHQDAYTLSKLFAAAGDMDGAAYFSKLLVSNDDDPVPTRLADRFVDAYVRAQVLAWKALSHFADEARLTMAVSSGDDVAALMALGGESALALAFTDTLKTRARPAFFAGAELALQELGMAPEKDASGLSLTEVNPAASEWARRHATEMIDDLGTKARQALKELIEMANEQGIPPDKVARAIIRDSMVGLLPKQAVAVRRYRRRLVQQGLDPETIGRRVTRYARAQLRMRAMTIARTELIGAVNGGQQALWQQAVKRGLLPADTLRVWIATLDDLLCEHICQPLDGTTAKINEPFKGGVMQPPAHPRCRCAVGIKRVPRKAAEAPPVAAPAVPEIHIHMPEQGKQGRKVRTIMRDKDGVIAGVSEETIDA